MTEQNEPALEAILASIRSVMADEDEEPDTEAEKEQVDNAPAPEEKLASLSKAEPENSLRAPETENIESAQPEFAFSPANEASEQEAVSENNDAFAPKDDVLDLTAEMIIDEPAVENTKADKKTQPPPSFDLKEDDEDDFTPEPVIPQEPMKEETLTDLIKENASKKLEEDMLLAEPTVAAATESLSHLRNIAVERQLELGNGSLTIEAIVRETLKPYLKEWLDIHLPEIVERVVRKEVAHIMDRLDLK